MSKTQTEKVYDYINTHGSITSLEAYTNLGITQLGARIFEMKRAGIAIKTTPKHVINRNGEKVRVVAYSWQSDNDPEIKGEA